MENTLPLSGIKVLDIGRFIAGPVSATFLAEFGAEVIKIERPRIGDELRRMGPAAEQYQSAWWLVEGRNKRLITLDFTKEEGRDILLELIEQNDVLIENFRPGTLERWGLSPEDLLERYPRLIVLRTSGYGQNGKRASDAGLNTAAEAMGGLRYLVGYPNDTPLRPGVAVADYLGALFGALGVLLALYERDVISGRGQWIDNALYEGVLRILEWTIPWFSQTGEIRQRSGPSDAGVAPARAYRTKDGNWVAIAIGSDDLFVRLATAMGAPKMAISNKFACNKDRVLNEKELSTLVESWTLTKTTKQVERILREASVPVCRVNSVAEIVEDEHIKERQALVTLDIGAGNEIMMQGVTPRLSRTPGVVTHAGRKIGYNNDEIYGSLLPPGQYQRLIDNGLI